MIYCRNCSSALRRPGSPPLDQGSKEEVGRENKKEQALRLLLPVLGRHNNLTRGWNSRVLVRGPIIPAPAVFLARLTGLAWSARVS